MIGKGKSISHGTAALEYDLAKEIDGQTAAIEIARHYHFGFIPLLSVFSVSYKTQNIDKQVNEIQIQLQC